MSTGVLLPPGAPFAPDQIAALNGVFGNSTGEQRAWLSGFLAGVVAASGGGARLAAPPAPPKARVPLTILFGTESGNSEALAQRARRAAAKLGFAVKLADMADTTPAQMAAVPNLMLIVATWGEGDPPQRAVDFHEALLAADAPRFEKTRFAVLSLGDRAYAQFCEIGRQMDERLAALGGARIVDRVDCDLDFETAAASWIDSTLDRIAKESTETVMAVEEAVTADFGAAETWTRANPFAGEIGEHARLTGSRSISDTRHLEISLEGSGIAYEPGDALGIVPRNDPELVDAVLKAAGLAGEASLRDALRDRFDITTLTAKQAADHAALAGTAAPAADWVAGRQVIDLLEAAPHKFSPQQLTTLLRPLPPRYYSIASSRKSVGEEAHLLVAGVRYEAHGRARAGVASIDMNERRKSGDKLDVFLRPNPHFRLPADPSRPIVMIGPGTGVAPFRGFLQEREATGAKGKNWLVFGHRNFMHDFLYQLEWQDWIKEGLLTRLDVAFSRDQPEKRYVQHALWDARDELTGWVKDGAALYVCGDMAAMAKDVHEMLTNILSKEQLDQLRRDGRYLRDVY